MPKARVVQAFSAGGVIFRARPSAEISATTANPAAKDATLVSRDSIEIALVGYPREGTWMLPKGTPKENESVEQTATREVREETGLEPRVLGELGSIDYWFARRGVRFHKEVFHYLMEAVGGDVSQHDHEYDEARWFSLADALVSLTYINEKEIARKAEPLILECLANGELEPDA